MLDKYKILRKAERFVIERKFSQAIQEYEKLLQKDGEDPSLLNTIGDLHIRVQKTAKALEYFHKVAQIYLNSGFALRAIATYKKIHSLDPSDLSVNQNLAELFQKQGLNQDACRHLDILIGHYKQAGSLDEAMELMEKAVSLDPERPGNHLQLAQALCEKGDPSGAADHYMKAVQALLQKKQYERVIEASRQALLSADFRGTLGDAHAQAADYLSRLDEADEALNRSLDEEGPFLPLTFALAMVAERKGEMSRASRLLDELVEKGHTDEAIQEAIKRLQAASFLDSESAASDRQTPQEAAQQPPASSDVNEQEFDFSSEDWSQQEELEESPFHPAGTVEEFQLEDEQGPAESTQQEDSGLSLASGSQGFELGADDDGLFEADFEAGQEALELQDGQPLSEESEAEDEEPPADELDEYATGSLEEALEEADFYLKLGFQEEATRVLKVLLRDHPEDERVVRRAKKIPGLAPAAPAKRPSVSPGQKVAQFDRQIDDALDVLFEGGEEDVPPEDEVLRYDVQKSGQPRGKDPKVHYDLGLAYKEMGLVEDAIQEFLSAVKLLDREEHIPQRILCCSTLANSYLQLDRYDDAIQWAREGLTIEKMKEFEWKALQYDLGCALESKEEFESALEVFREITGRDKNYRDVPARIERLAPGD